MLALGAFLAGCKTVPKPPEEPAAITHPAEMPAEDQPEEIDPEADPAMNSFESLEDLKKIDGFDDAALTRNRLNADTLTVLSTVFSVHLVAESGDGLRRQERYVLERNARGFRTLMAEERNDPVPQGEEEEE